MVRESLNKFINKYPYFLTREPSSIFYRTSSVNNRQIQKLYCELFNVYQSFHLEKRILMWKEQNKPYDYTIHFVANYDDLKRIQIFKNDILIKEVSYDDLGVDNFEWEYNATYVEHNIIELKSYKCSECGTIYFDDNLPVECTCGNSEYIPLTVYECSECGEIYFIDTLDESVNHSDCSINNHTDTLEELHIFKCRECGDVFFQKETDVEVCPSCTVEDTNNLAQYHIIASENEEVLDEYGDSVTVQIYNENDELVDTVNLTSSNNWETYTIPLNINNSEGEPINYHLEYDNPNYNVVLGDYVKHQTPSTNKVSSPIYYNDKYVELIDNSEDYSDPMEYDFLSYEDYLYLKNNGKIHILGRRNHLLAEGESLEEYNDDEELLVNPNPSVNTFDVDIVDVRTDEVVGTVSLTPLRTLPNGDIIMTTSPDWIFSETPTWETYSDELPVFDENGEEIMYHLQYDNDYFDVQIVDHTPLLYNYTLTYEEILNSNGVLFDENLEGSGEEFLIEIPLIPSDEFRMIVTTYEEYVIEKGFPETDYTLMEYNRALKENIIEPNVFDHDYSLDELGALNNIPRKKYEIITDPLLYPRTEPPYNNRETEDDYHYMNRMLEYNTRQWWMNPVSLELWKLYGVESELINRERYLLKVFDEQMHPFNEETELVECWSPRAWEHKDRFCDGSKSLGEYFFAYTNTIRPIVDEDVFCYFHVMNMLGEELPFEDYTIRIDKIITEADKQTDMRRANNNLPLLYEDYNVGDTYLLQEELKSNKYIIESEYLSDVKDPSTHQATNIFAFKCFKPNGEQLGYDEKKSIAENEKYNRNYILINVRNYENSDWFVNPKPSEYLDDYGEVISGYKGKGTITEPFLTIEEAVDKVTPGLNLIGLADSININTPISVDKTCTIIGQDNFIPTSQEGFLQRKVPRIFQKGTERIDSNLIYNRRFFNVVGGKNNTLTLSNLRLVSGEINDYININSWQNTNPNKDNLFSVYVHGGAVIMTITLDENKYYPYDFISGTVLLTKGENNTDTETPLVNNTVEVYYKNNLIQSYQTDENGEFRFLFNLQEYVQNEYSLVFKNKSNVFFEATIPQLIDATTPFTTNPIYLYQGETVNLVSENHTGEEEVKYYSDQNGLLNIIPIDNNGEGVLQTYKPVFGRHIIYTTYNNEWNGRVRDEWYVESKADLSKAYSYLMEHHNTDELICNLVFDKNNGVFTYDKLTITQNMTMKDLEGVATDVYLKGDDMIINSFHCPIPLEDNTEIYYTDAKELEKALVDINLTLDGVLTTTRIGEFWRREPSSISLTPLEDVVEYTDSVTIEGELEVNTGEVEDIDLFIDEVYTTTIQTGNDGLFSYTVEEDLSIGEHTIRCEWGGNTIYDYCTANVDVLVENNIHITLSSDKTTAYISSTILLTGAVTESGVGLDGRQVEIYNRTSNGENDLIDVVTTDSNGDYEYELQSPENPYTLNLFTKLVDVDYDDITSPIVTINVKKLNTSITLNINSTWSITYSQSATFSGRLTDELNRGVNGVTITLKQNGYSVATTTTNSNGEYSFSARQYNSADTYYIQVVSSSTSSYNPTATAKYLTVNKAPVTVDVETSKLTYTYGEQIPISVTSNYGTVNPSSVTVYYLYQVGNSWGVSSSVLTNKVNGKFIFTIPSVLNDGMYNYADGTHRIYAKWNGDDNYNSSQSTEKTINVVNDSFDNIALSLLSTRKFRMTFKQGNNPVKNKTISQILFYLTLNGSSFPTITIDNKTTDATGSIDFDGLTLSDSVSGSAYVTSEGVTSNIINF